MVTIDLFSGVGGMSLGLKQAGLEIGAAFDSDVMQTSTYSRNFPTVPVFTANLSRLGGKELLRLSGIRRNSVDVVAGGSPCQGFSTMGRRQRDDPRNKLLADFARLVVEIRPQYFVLENVVGLTHVGNQPTLRAFKRRIERANYRVLSPIEILDAKDFGVPQSRKRVFVLGSRTGAVKVAYPKVGVLRARDPLTRRPKVADAISDLPDVDKYPELLGTDVFRGSLGRPSAYASLMRGSGTDRFDRSRLRRKPSHILTGCGRTVHSEEVRKRFEKTKPGTQESISRFYRLTNNGVARALRAGTRSSHGSHTAARPIHPDKPRCVTVREGARLHSFPDWFDFHPTIWHGFRQVGNSVPPFLARAVGNSIRVALGA